jgi:Mg-chelatase subunit ChlD
LETEKIKLESQIDTLLRYDGDELTTYAAGLNLPENVIKETHPKLLEAKRKLEAAKLEGLAAGHPEMQERKVEVERLEAQTQEGVVALRETLRSQLELVKEQSERLRIKKDKAMDEAVTHGIARYSFEDAKSDFESAQSLLEKLKVKLIAEEMQRRVSENPVVVHEEAKVEGPGFLSLDRRHRGRSVVQVRPKAPGVEVLPGYVTKDAAAGSPTFFPTEFEVMKSQKTLRKAIELGGLRELTGKSEADLIRELEKNLDVENVKGTDLIEIEYRDHDERLARKVVDAVGDAYRQRRAELESQRQERAMQELREAVRSQEDLVEEKRKVLTQLIRNEGVVYSRGNEAIEEAPEVLPKPDLSKTLDLMAEVAASEDPFSTFSLHVSDASFKLAAAALERGERPDPEGIRPEEFYNAFDYGDPAPSDGEPVACAMEQAAHPAFPQRNLLRIAVRAGASGRAQSVPLNLTLLLDNSGSMERDDRAEGVARAVDQLSSLLKPGDKVTVAGFSRTPRLLADRLDGAQAAQLNEIVRQVPAEGGTNLEQALVLGEELATRQFVPGAQNRMVLFTDGAANLGDADPESLNTRVETMRQNGIAFDAAGFGADGLNDRLLERLTRNGNGRYYVVDDPSEADEGFANKLAGAFRPAAENVKVQVVFNPERVGNYKLIGFEEHRLKKEDFRDDTVDAAEMAAEEAGVALYQMQVLPQGRGEIGEVRVRFRDAAGGEMVERSWTIPYESDAPAFDQASESLQLATLAALAAEKLRDAPMAGVIDFRELAPVIGRVAARYDGSERVAALRRMIEKLR